MGAKKKLVNLCAASVTTPTDLRHSVDELRILIGLDGVD